MFQISQDVQKGANFIEKIALKDSRKSAWRNKICWKIFFPCCRSLFAVHSSPLIPSQPPVLYLFSQPLNRHPASMVSYSCRQTLSDPFSPYLRLWFLFKLATAVFLDFVAALLTLPQLSVFSLYPCFQPPLDALFLFSFAFAGFSFSVTPPAPYLSCWSPLSFFSDLFFFAAPPPLGFYMGNLQP